MAHMTIDLSKIDWKIFSTQKIVLLHWIEFFQEYQDNFPELDLSLDDFDFSEVGAMEGLVDFLDDYQDKAAEIIGEETVFPHLGDGEEGELG